MIVRKSMFVLGFVMSFVVSGSMFGSGVQQLIGIKPSKEEQPKKENLKKYAQIANALNEVRKNSRAINDIQDKYVYVRGTLWEIHDELETLPEQVTIKKLLEDIIEDFDRINGSEFTLTYPERLAARNKEIANAMAGVALFNDKDNKPELGKKVINSILASIKDVQNNIYPEFFATPKQEVHVGTGFGAYFAPVAKPFVKTQIKLKVSTQPKIETKNLIARKKYPTISTKNIDMLLKVGVEKKMTSEEM